MPLTPGDSLGPYSIVALIGAGGMGEVYRARDPRLGRDVAIKVLPASLAEDPDRRERFEREARAASALNHPNICALYDVGRQGGVEYLVMELLEGESLADRLARGPLPLDEALRVGIAIADALAKAHRQGIVHRDLKPGNVMLTRQGAKLLDFGLARVDAAAAAPAGGSLMPTQQKSLTQAGTLLGTFQYMAPEQLEGGEADARTDIFAFGALLYEAVTGRKAFEGKSQASLISSIMGGTPPPVSSIQPMTPPALDRVIRTCLVKDPDLRWQTAQDLAAELRWIAEGGSQVGAPAPVVARRRSKERLAWAAAGVFAVVSAALAYRVFTTKPIAREPTRFAIAPPKGITLTWPRISPDGRTVAFVGIDADGHRAIWIRPLGSFEPAKLGGTEGVGRPFWSPDSRYLAFFAGAQLKKIAIAGGPPQLLCEWPGGSDGSWGDGVILFDGRAADPIRRVPDSGGVPAVAVAPDAAAKEVGTAWPYFLPDGHHFLFLGNDSKGPARLKIGSIDNAKVSTLGDAVSRVEYSSGHVFYVSQQTLMARPFSTRSLAFTGEPFPVTDRIQLQQLGLVDFSTSQSGDLAYSSEALEQRTRLMWVDRNGKEGATVGEPKRYSDIALSADESRAAVAVLGAATVSDIWVVDLKRGVESPLTFGDGLRLYPVWSPDGTRVAYARLTEDGARLRVVQKLASGAGNELPLGDEDKAGILFPTDWSPDGHQLMIQWVSTAADNFDLVTLAADGRSPFAPLLRTPKPILEMRGRFSPDGKWFAYESNEAGRFEVYVQPYPPSGGKWQISTAGGQEPFWTKGGREIVYRAPDDSFWAVSLRPGANALDIDTPQRLFQHRLTHGAQERNHWVPTRSGEQFLLNTRLDDTGTRTIQVVLDWTAGLKKP